MKSKRWLTLFVNAQNIHLTKDVGMIPYIMSKDFKYDSTIASYKIGEYPYLSHEVKGLKQSFIKKITGNDTLDGLIYLFLNFRKYDILQVYHFTTTSILWCYFFKIIKLGKGRTYLKLDANASIKTQKFGAAKSAVIDHILSTIDLISVETKHLHNFLSNNWKVKVEYIPNGFYEANKRASLNLDLKQDIILHVGRIGNYLKNNEVLFEGFKSFAAQNDTWKLVVVGTIETGFEEYIQDFIRENPSLQARIILTGPIADRQIISDWYSKAKVFVMTSRSESFGLVYLEAMQHGCYILSSDVLPAYDITDNERYGKLFPVGDSLKLAQLLNSTASDSELIYNNASKAQNFAYKEFYWPNICAKINQFFE